MDTSKIVPALESAEITINRQCRVCMEGENTSSPLLSPCKCSGSIRYIHEECLKTWLVSHMEDIAESVCELCKTPLLMEFRMKHHCKPQNSCKNGLNSCIFVPVLIAIVIILFIIVYLLADRYLSSASGAQEKGYTIALIITCGVSGIILSILIITSLKEACIITELDDWKIFSQNFEEDEQSIEIKMEDFPANQIIIVPEHTKVDGVKVKTPKLTPVLQAVNKRGNIVAYTPHCMTPNYSLFRPTPVPPAARSDPFKSKNKSPRPGASFGYQNIEDSLNYI